MKRVRVEQPVRRPREDAPSILPVDPRDPDVVRAKRAGQAAAADKHRL